MVAFYFVTERDVIGCFIAFRDVIGCFVTGRDVLKLTPEENFIIMIPPPNVTGALHLGHTFTGAV